MDIAVFNARGVQNLPRVRFRAGTCRADRYAFAAQIIDRFDAGFFQRYDLYRFRIQRRYAAQVVNFFAVKHFQAVRRIVGDIVLDQRQIQRAVFEHIDVGDRGPGALRGRIDIGDIFIE